MQDPISKYKSIFQRKNYIFSEDLNIIGIRNKNVGNVVTNKFDDILVLLYKDSLGKWIYKEYAITTDPGLYYVVNELLSPKGTGIMKEGQYLNCYAIDYHQGKYLALCQTWGKINVYRDRNKDNYYDFENEESGMFGGNIHCAGIDSILIDKWSAMCQVFKRKKDFDEFMQIISLFKNKFNNKYTYTLINTLDFN